MEITPVLGFLAIRQELSRVWIYPLTESSLAGTVSGSHREGILCSDLVALGLELCYVNRSRVSISQGNIHRLSSFCQGHRYTRRPVCTRSIRTIISKVVCSSRQVGPEINCRRCGTRARVGVLSNECPGCSGRYGWT